MNAHVRSCFVCRFGSGETWLICANVSKLCYIEPVCANVSKLCYTEPICANVSKLCYIELMCAMSVNCAT